MHLVVNCQGELIVALIFKWTGWNFSCLQKLHVSLNFEEHPSDMVTVFYKVVVIKNVTLFSNHLIGPFVTLQDKCSALQYWVV